MNTQNMAGVQDTANFKDLLNKTTTSRAKIALKLWAQWTGSTDDFLGASTSVAVMPTRNEPRVHGSSPPPGTSLANNTPSRRHQPAKYHRAVITEALAAGDLLRLHGAVDAAERDLMKELGVGRAFDADDPYWLAAVENSTGTGPDEVAVRLDCPREFVCRYRILRERDPQTGQPAQYGDLELRAIAMLNEGRPYREIRNKTGVSTTTLSDWINGKRKSLSSRSGT